MKLCRALLAILVLLVGADLRAQTVDLSAHTQPLADISHERWRFHPGDDPRYADPAFDDSNWPLITADKPWDKQGFEHLTGYGWYRIHIKVDPKQPLMFVSGIVYNDCEVFADGHKIATWGRLGQNPEPIYPHDLWSVVANLPPHSGEVVLAVRIWAWPPIAAVQGGGFSGENHLPVLLGSPDTVIPTVALRKNQKLVEYSAETTLGLLYVLAGILAIMLYVRERDSTEYLWFALFAVPSGLHPICELAVSTWIPTLGMWFDSSEAIFIDLPRVSLLFFFFRFIRLPITRLARWVILLQAAVLVVNQLNSFIRFISFQTISFITSFSSMILFGTIVWLVLSLWRRVAGVRKLALPMVLLGVANLYFEVSYVPFSMGLADRPPPLFDYPVRFGELDIAGLIFLAALAYILIERFAETRSERRRLTGEFESARTVQQLLIPDLLPSIPGLKIESAYEPAQQVGGDFFHVMPLEDGAALVVLGDVAGKGMQAAMTVVLLIGALRTEAEHTVEPTLLMRALNRNLCGHQTGFTTCVILHIAMTGEVTAANAGHLHPYLAGIEVELDAGLPLGFDPDAEYPETHFQLPPGKRLTLLTDGVVEATNPERELFGFARTQDVSVGSAGAIARAAQSFTGTAPQADDITVLTLVRVG